MTVEARKRKNQKKRLKLKEKKAAERAALESIARDDDVEVTGISSDPLIVDRVAAEQVLPPPMLRGKADELVSQTEWTRQDSPQISTEPMGQALEISLDSEDQGSQDGQDQEENVYSPNHGQISEGRAYPFSGGIQTDSIPREICQSTENDTASVNIPDEMRTSEVAPEGSIVSIEQAIQASKRVSETSSTQEIHAKLFENSTKLKISEETQQKDKEVTMNWTSAEQSDEPLGDVEHKKPDTTVWGNIQSAAISEEPDSSPQEQTQGKDPENIDSQAGIKSPRGEESEQLRGQTSQHTEVQLHKPRTEQQLEDDENIDETNEEKHKAESGDVLRSSQVMKACNTGLEDSEKEFVSNQTPEDSLEDLEEENQTREPASLKDEIRVTTVSAEIEQESIPRKSPVHLKNPQETTSSTSEVIGGTIGELNKASDQESLKDPSNNEYQGQALFGVLTERENNEQKLLTTKATVHEVLMTAPEAVKNPEPIEAQEYEQIFESKKQNNGISMAKQSPKDEVEVDTLFGEVEHGQCELMPWDITPQGTQEPSGSIMSTSAAEVVNSLDPARKSREDSDDNRQVPEPHENKQSFKDETKMNALFGETKEEGNHESLPWEVPEAPGFVEPMPSLIHDTTSARDQQSETVIDPIKESQKPSGNLVQPKYDDQVEKLFDETEKAEQETLPRAPSESTQNTSKMEASTEQIDKQLFKAQKNVEPSVTQVDSLFGEAQYQPMPWETSHNLQDTEEDTAAAEGKTSSENNMDMDQAESAKTKKFSFLEDDDDLLDDDDSYLDSDEELEGQQEHGEDAVWAMNSELIDPGDENITRDQSQTQTTNTKSTFSNSPTNLHGTTSRYKPNNAVQVESSGLQQRDYETGVPPQAIKNNIGVSVLPSTQQRQLGFATQRQNVLEGQKVIEKINQEKKKSDAFDFPMDLVSKKTERIPAKPVGVPASHFTSPPPFEVAGPAPPRNARANPITALPSNPYAAAADASKSKMQAPLPPQGVVLPQNALPLGSQLPTPQAIPFPTNRQPSVRPQNSLGLRTRGFSNISGGSLSAGTVGTIATPHAPSAPRRVTESKYTPASPMKPATMYPPVSGVSGPMGTHRINGGPVNIVPLGGGLCGPQNSVQKLPVSPSFSNIAPNVPSAVPQNFAIPPPYDKPVVAPVPNNPSQGYSLVGTPSNISGGLATGTHQKQATGRSHARSNSSVYAPNQSEFNSKYAPTVHPQYKHPSPPAMTMGLQNPLSSINSYMSETQPERVLGPGAAEMLPVPKSVDNEALLQHQFPLFSWSASERINYGIPIDNGQNAYIVGSSSTVQSFSLANVDSILLPQNFLKSFPGPLSKNKTRRKDLQKWFDDHADEFGIEENHLNSTIVSILKLKLDDNINFKDISRILYNSDELLLYLSQPVMQPIQIPSACKLDANNQMRVSAYLQTGGQDEALQLALGMNDFSMALLIGSLMGKEKWSEVVESYLAHEMELGANDSGFVKNLFSMIFPVFIGSSKTAFQEFYVNDTKCKWALDNWRMVVAAVLNNISAAVKSVHTGVLEVPPVVVEFLLEYGVFLSRKGMNLAACILFMIANLPLSPGPIFPETDVKFESVGSPGSLESLIFSEIYEFCISDSKAFPILLPQKLYHAVCLQEHGLTTAASKYTDYLNGVLRTLPKKEPFTITLTHRLNDLNACIAGTSTGWLGKPKLSSVWGHLDKSFNKLIGGDDDVLIKKSVGKKVFDGFTPVCSRNNSTLDLSQTPFVPYQGHSKKPSLGHSEGGNSIQPIGHSPIRNTVPIEKAYTGKSHPESHSRRSSQMNNAYQDSPKASHYNPSRSSSASHVPPKLRRVQTMQPIGGQLPPFMPVSTESLNIIPDYQGKHFSNGNFQETRAAAFSEDEVISTSNKPSLYCNSTPNLLRRSSVASASSDTSAVGTENSNIGRKFGDVSHGLVEEPLDETIEETGFASKSPPKDSGESASDGRQLLTERPNLVGPTYVQDNERSPVSTVATEAATDDDGMNSEAESTVRHNETVPLTGTSIKPNLNLPSLATMSGQGSGDTSKQNEECDKESFESLVTTSEDVPSVRADKSEPGLGIKMRGSQSDSSRENKMNPPVLFKTNPYAADIPIRKTSSSKAAYVPKNSAQGPVRASSAQQTPQVDVNGLGMFVEKSNVLNRSQEEKFVVSPSSDSKTFTSVLQQPTPEFGRTNPMSRFDPIKEPEEISTKTFEPVIKKTPKIRAFTPLVVQPAETQYDDIVEDESEDEDEESVKAKREKEEKRAREEEAKAKEEKERQERKKAKQSKMEQEKESQEKSSNSWFGWLKKDPNEKKPIKAKLGNKKRNFHYDEKLKRWVNNNATEEEKEKFSTPPPPPPVVKRVDNSPKTKPRSGSVNTLAKPITGAVVPKNPFTGEPLNSPSPSTLSRASSEVPPVPPLASSSGVNLAGRKANGLDDLLNLSGCGGTGTRRKKKPGRGYVNVMENK